jgi:Peptidase A4 family
MIMAAKAASKMKGVRVFPPPPKNFDAVAATPKELARHGIPQRPDPRTQPVLAALWEQYARRYQRFEHLEPKLLPVEKPKRPTKAVARGLGLSPIESCGFELFSTTGPITQFSGTWTVPDLKNSPNSGLPNEFRTFFGLGFLDVHVEMTVDANQNVTSVIQIQPGAQVALPVRPGDVISATLCLQTDTAGTAFFGLANETTSQSVNFQFETHFPPAVRINAGISRGSIFNGPLDPLARFGVVYFDELRAFRGNETILLTHGVPTTMVDSNGSTLALPKRIGDFTFKVIYEGA